MIGWCYTNVIYYGHRSTHAEFYTVGNGVGMIWLDDVICTKTSDGIDMCRHRGWGMHECNHGEDVGVRCIGGYEIFQGNKMNIPIWKKKIITCLWFLSFYFVNQHDLSFISVKFNLLIWLIV